MNVNTLFLAGIVTTAAFASLGCDNDPAKGKTKVEAAAPVEQKRQEAKQSSETLTISPADGSIGFVGAKITDKHEGAFQKFEGKIDYVDNALDKSGVEVTIDIASITVEPEKLKKHLLSPDFFDVEKYPKATFTSTTIVEKKGDGSTHEVTGNLELRGAKKSITFPATITASETGVGIETEFAINRKDFGIVYPGMPDDLIKDDVLIKLSLHPKKG